MADRQTSQMLSYEAAVAQIADVAPLSQTERVTLSQAVSRILADDVQARLNQPPHAVSSMDGYAVRSSDLYVENRQLTVIGEIAAGDQPGTVSIGKGQAARIFTGAPIPSGSDSVVIQENVTVCAPDKIAVEGDARPDQYIRPASYDFTAEQTVLTSGRVLRSADLALAAAAGHEKLSVIRKPKVAIISTGNELVEPGTVPAPGQIIASNALGVSALVENFGAHPINLGIGRDDLGELKAIFTEAMAAGADVIVTLGGASVGDHDLVRPAFEAIGARLDFWKVAVRPGKPLMYGQLKTARILGLPGNPVSSLVCAHIFLQPLLRRLLNQSSGLPAQTGVLGSPVPANGARRHFMRGQIIGATGGKAMVRPLEDQDSSLLSRLSQAEILINVPPHHEGIAAGEHCEYILLQ